MAAKAEETHVTEEKHETPGNNTQVNKQFTAS